jgi:hypothetical protein
MITQQSIECMTLVIQFIQDVQTIAYDLCKSLIVDASLLKYKPSILAATLLFLGFQLQFEISQEAGTFDLSTKRGRDITWQVC